MEQVELTGAGGKEGTGAVDTSSELSLDINGRLLEREEAESLC